MSVLDYGRCDICGTDDVSHTWVFSYHEEENGVANTLSACPSCWEDRPQFSRMCRIRAHLGFASLDCPHPDCVVASVIDA